MIYVQQSLCLAVTLDWDGGTDKTQTSDSVLNQDKNAHLLVSDIEREGFEQQKAHRGELETISFLPSFRIYIIQKISSQFWKKNL